MCMYIWMDVHALVLPLSPSSSAKALEAPPLKLGLLRPGSHGRLSFREPFYHIADFRINQPCPLKPCPKSVMPGHASQVLLQNLAKHQFRSV